MQLDDIKRKSGPENGNQPLKSKAKIMETLTRCLFVSILFVFSSADKVFPVFSPKQGNQILLLVMFKFQILGKCT